MPRHAKNLREFVRVLEEGGELARVRAPVSPILEISAITDRESKRVCARSSATAAAFDPMHADQGGRALLFERVEGADFPLLVNAYGSYRRTELALGVADSGGFEAIAARIAALTKPEPPTSLRAALKKAGEFLPLLRVPPRRVARGACQDVVRLSARGDVDLTRLPLLKCWPLDGDPAAVGFGMSAARAGTAAGGGRYVTFAGVHTVHADDRDATRPASHNIGMYRAQLLDATHLAMHWHMHHDGAAHWRSWKRLGAPMPIALCLGGEPVLPYAATAPLPPGLSELLLAGFLNGGGIPMVRARTVPLWVPANSEIVIEGWVSTECGGIGFDPRAHGATLGPGAVLEGPFGDHTGFYSLPDRYPRVDVTALTHRREAIYPTTIVGLPPQEDYYLGKATERVFLPLLKTLIHDVDDYHLPRFGCFHNAAFVRIAKSYPLQARRVMSSVWGAGQMAWTKFVVVVDDDVAVHEEDAVWRAVFSRCRFDRDLELVNGPLDILDHAAPRLGAGHKLGIDATRKVPGDEVNGVAADRAPRIPTAQELRVLESRMSGAAGTAAGLRSLTFPAVGAGRLAFVSVHKQRAGDGARVLDALWRETVDGVADFVVVVDRDVDLADVERVFFLMCANADPGRDLHRREAKVGIDATRKVAGDERLGQPVRDFPPLLAMDPEIDARVERRWGEYGL